jgi:glycerol kinase
MRRQRRRGRRRRHRNQRETTVVWDRDTGLPVCNAIVWHCRRTAEDCEAISGTRR